ncbi:MAG: hypothetical protein HC800_05065 [Phormidesmis sp. RL_2_1]|nr:hypothetical protein [Phormidesmis sp. RL_2_1]
MAAAIAMPLSVQQSPVALHPDEGDDEGAPMTRTDTRTDHYLNPVRGSRAFLPASVHHLVGDAAYSTLKWVNAISQLDLDVIGKLRCDADLRYVYEGPQKPRGAPRKYDGKVYCDDLSR